jgi:hypothetical protein
LRNVLLGGWSGRHCWVGGSEGHKRQLLRLLEVGKARNVTIQVLPFVGAGPGVDGPFVLVETGEHELLVFEEGLETVRRRR